MKPIDFLRPDLGETLTPHKTRTVLNKKDVRISDGTREYRILSYYIGPDLTPWIDIEVIPTGNKNCDHKNKRHYPEGDNWCPDCQSAWFGEE